MKEVETIYIEIPSKCGKKIVMGSLYRAPNTNSTNFTTQLNVVIDKIQQEKGEKKLNYMNGTQSGLSQM